MSNELKKELVVIENTDEVKLKEISVKKRVEAISTGDKFNLFQEMLQEIQAMDIMESVDHENSIPLTKQIEKLKEYITVHYKDDINTRDLLLEYFPSYKTINAWTQKQDWKDEVVKKIKGSFNFSEKRRTRVFDAIYQKATQKGDMRAAELFCKLSGDLSSGTGSKEQKEDNMTKYTKLMQGKK